MSGNALFPKGAALVLGASGGIGGKIAEVLAQDGADIALVYNRKADAVARVASACKTRTTQHKCDVTDPEAVAKLIAEVVAEHGRIHTLVWAAGPLWSNSSFLKPRWRRGDAPLRWKFMACLD